MLDRRSFGLQVAVLAFQFAQPLAPVLCRLAQFFRPAWRFFGQVNLVVGFGFIAQRDDNRRVIIGFMRLAIVPQGLLEPPKSFAWHGTFFVD